MAQFWEEKIDYLELQLSELSNNLLLNNSFDYFVGIAEILLEYLKRNYSEENIDLKLSHRCLNCLDSIEYYNPLNISFDLAYKDIAAYLRKSKDIDLTIDIIDKAIKEAKEHEEEDKKRKELVDLKNQADNLVFALEKMLRDNGDKISAEDKEKLEKSIEKAKEQFKSDDAETIRKAMEELSKENEAVVTKLYQAAQEKAQAENADNKENKKDDNDEVIIDDNDKK